MKRIFDIIISLVLIILLLPVFITVFILIYWKLGKPIIFRQKRPGYLAKIFTLYKFRTMHVVSDDQGNDLPDSMRITRLGRFLRKTSLDELPSLVNVLKGEMSLVGPRPLLIEYLPFYTAEQSRRHLVKPGMTGWAQIYGRNSLSWAEKFKLDCWYVDHQFFLLDLFILFKTMIVVLQQKNINADNHVTMPNFIDTIHHD
jgi:sugar transferase EpsL